MLVLIENQTSSSDTLTIVNKSLANYAWNIFVLPAPHLSLSCPPDAPLTTVPPHPSLILSSSERSYYRETIIKTVSPNQKVSDTRCFQNRLLYSFCTGFLVLFLSKRSTRISKNIQIAMNRTEPCNISARNSVKC